jgi:hypothetical protein
MVMRSIVQVRRSSASQEQVNHAKTNFARIIHKTCVKGIRRAYPARPHIFCDPESEKNRIRLPNLIMFWAVRRHLHFYSS